MIIRMWMCDVDELKRNLLLLWLRLRATKAKEICHVIESKYRREKE